MGTDDHPKTGGNGVGVKTVLEKGTCKTSFAYFFRIFQLSPLGTSLAPLHSQAS